MHLKIDDFFTEIYNSYVKGLPFVAYREPLSKKLKFYVQKNADLNVLDSFDKSGFLFAPFNKNERKIFFPLETCKVSDAIIEDLNELKVSSKSCSAIEVEEFDNSKEYHINIVKEGVDFIKKNKAKKIVLSRSEKLKFDDLNFIDTYKRMLTSYSNAFVYIWFHPKVGMWMGATPERLLYIEEGTFRTMSLAGTQEYIDTENADWNEKEIVEQQIVTDYILKNVKGTISNIKTKGPYTVKAGKLLHLRTDISGEVKEQDSVNNLINSLHPTPAICGMPKKEAAKFILEKENYSRTFYTGYLGELNVDNTTNLFVNLRCMELDKSNATIFIGGGITIDSDPIKEWEETVSKSKIMKKVLE